ncbi:MAG: hypothetical protein KJP23_15550, partial [Deltaproteobacteria bacterium]|nr:hypothetical protein [Deltaproteobacteria bacterium]
VGLNLSDITNCVKVFVTDSEELDAQILRDSISIVAELTNKTDFPALLYPVAYADQQQIEYEKIYNLWICSMQNLDELFGYLKRLLRFI